MNVRSRRDFLKAASVAALASGTGIHKANARTAEFTLRYANNVPVTHPINIRAKQMAARIATETNGRVDFQVYPNSQLGRDTDALAQIRSGAIDFLTLSPLILGTYIPSAQITGVGFAFQSYDQVWSAVDGDLGAYVRRQIGATPLFAFEKIWNNGFREITTGTRALNNVHDMRGLRLRVPPGPLFTSLFKALGVSPASINFSETYSALQTRMVDSQENSLSIIYTAKLYEVQKFCALTAHMWDGFWFLGNKQSFSTLPQDIQATIAAAVNEAGVQERTDVQQMDSRVRTKLEASGMKFNEPEKDVFRKKLIESGFYQEWQRKFGPAWAVLERYTGRIG